MEESQLIIKSQDGSAGHYPVKGTGADHPPTLGAGAVQNLPNTQAQTGSLLSASQSSVGILQATQAGNQLVAVQTGQLADLTALLG